MLLSFSVSTKSVILPFVAFSWLVVDDILLSSNSFWFAFLTDGVPWCTSIRNYVNYYNSFNENNIGKLLRYGIYLMCFVYLIPESLFDRLRMKFTAKVRKDDLQSCWDVFNMILYARERVGEVWDRLRYCNDRDCSSPKLSFDVKILY